MQADGGLIHHVEHPSGSVPHRTRELHALALPRGKRGARAVEREVSQSQLQQAPSGARKRVADGSRHGAHLIRKTPGHTFHPRNRLVKRHFRCLCQVDAAHKRPARGIRETRATAIGTRPLGQVLRDAAQPLLVLRLRKRVFHGAHGVVVGEIELGEVLAILRLVQDVPLLGWTVEHDVALSWRKLAKRHVRAHAHGAAHLLHEVPHKRAPHHNSTLVDGLALVGHERRAVHGARDTGAATGRTSALTVEGELLSTGAEELAAAVGARNRQFSSDIQAWRHMLAAMWAHVAADAREEKPQAVQ